jgi:transposase-like protein
MSHPRAIIPPSALAHYRQHGGKATARAYGHSWETLRRWLIEHGERTEFIYTSARLAVRALLDERRIEECQIHDGPMTYRLPANTPMEPRK